MPTKIEKDAFSGRDTTGHEWDGLKELNTPLPKWWFWTFVVTIIWAVVFSIFYPSVPWVHGYFRGVLGYTSRAAVDLDVKALQAQREVVMKQVNATPIEDVRKDPKLMAVATVAGRIAFAENCQACHGAGGEGRTGFPSLADDVWIWGGKLADIQTTITHGVRAGDPDARVSQMPRFGVDGVLKPDEIQAAADYVMTLYGKPVPGAKDVEKGAQIFADNCVICHGDKGQGNREVGGPALKSAVHLYGSTRDVVVSQVTNPHMGVMPNWNKRLDAATIKSLALYVHSLGGGE